MSHTHIDSPAFLAAQMRSERVRIVGLLSFLGILIVVLLIRLFLLHTTVLSSHALWNVILALTLGLYEALMLSLVTRALREKTSFPQSIWYFSTILETCVPALGVALLTSSGFDPIYRPLASPATLLFFVFIILYVLRLDPWICRLSGIVAAVSYVVACYHLGWRPPIIGEQSPVTRTDVGLYAVILLCSGFIAGGVAAEIHKHVEAALREATTRRQLDRIQHDLQTARDIQQALLPQSAPQVAGLAIAGWNKPADDTGGDFYDWDPLPDGRLIVVLADVTGHGVGPALLAAACRAYSRSSFASQPNLPSALTAINSAIGRDLEPDRFVTLAAVACTHATCELEVLSAGHGPMLHYCAAEDKFQEVDSQGLPLGVVPDFVSGPPTKLSLQPGDLFLLITDGFVEYENAAQEEYGKRRLQAAVRESKSLPPQEIIAALYESVKSFAGGTRQQDDLTAVFIKRI
jgi:serine phosphatase RsbU (regulator of sigma subunit)